MHSLMKIQKVAAITILILSSVAANSVAPTKSELESMYDKAFREFDSNNFPQALKELDAIDARQPDLAESQNLRGVIFMRQGIYDKAEAALYRAIELDSKFWNARFNLAEIPFLQKNWTEARNRFQGLLSSNSSELQGEATQLIQYKILLTYILEGKDNMVDAFLSKFELSNNTPAVQYGNAAIAFHQKDEKAAKEWIAAAEKNFSPQLNKLFAESLYEVGWLQKPAGQSRAALELSSTAERTARARAFVKAKLDEAEEAFQKRDLASALKLLDEADSLEPNQPSHMNLRGEILMEQKDFDQAEDFFQKALKVDPKFREAQYNLAQIPFKKKEYGKARDRLESLFAATPGGDKNQAAQLIKFKIFMTLLLEGKESRAQKMMDQFQFTGDTPALYYAQAAWEFQHRNPDKANDWITSARKIYSQALNIVFADSFYDAGWLQSAASVEEPAPSQPVLAQNEAAVPGGANPVVEPSPIPGTVAAESQPAQEVSASVTPSASPVIAGMEATTSPKTASVSSSSPVPVITAPATSESVVQTAKPEAQQNLAEASSPAASAPAQVVAPIASAATPATVLAPASVGEWSKPTVGEAFYRMNDLRALLVAVLLLAGIGLLAWVIVPELRRRLVPAFYRRVTPAAGPDLGQIENMTLNEDITVNEEMTEEMAPRHRFTGGPPQRSVQLKATEPSVRRTVIPVIKPAPDFTAPELGRAIEEFPSATPEEAVVAAETTTEEFVPEISQIVTEESVPVAEEIVSSTEQPTEFAASVPVEPEIPVTMEREPEFEPVTQGQPIPYQVPADIPEPIAEISRPEPEPVFASKVISTEPSVQQPTTPATMPEPTQTPPVIRTAPSAGAAMPAAGTMQTAVQLTFSCEIASLQLTPAFKMGALQVKPISRIVMMRLAPSQHPQPAMNLQVTFEVATVQPSGGSLGTVRLTPSQQQKPGVLTSPAFAIAGVQLVSNAENAPVQLTPSQQGKASVHVTAAFQISTVEFSPSFEIASIVLNSSSKNVSVQLPGAGPSAIEAAPVFEVASVQLGGNGEIGLMSLHPPGAAAPRRG